MSYEFNSDHSIAFSYPNEMQEHRLQDSTVPRGPTP